VSLIAGIEFQFDLNFQEIDLQETESYLRDITSKYSDIIFGQQTDIRAILEEGSLKATLLVLGTLYIAIGQYGSFRSGIDYMINDAKSLKDLVSSQIIKNGLNEASIMESKRIQCDPDKIRKVLLSIERLESKKNLVPEEIEKDISKIKTSVRNICGHLNDEDAGFFVSSIQQRYWPDDRKIPYFIERYNLVVREEEISKSRLTVLNTQARRLG
jgi:hypothetical protein